MRDEIKETASCRKTKSASAGAAGVNFKKPLNIITNNNTSDENGSH